MTEAIAMQLDEQRAAIDARWAEAARRLAAIDAGSWELVEHILDQAQPMALAGHMRAHPLLAIDVQRLAALALDELLLRAKGGR